MTQNLVNRVATEQIPNVDDALLNPTLRVFDQNTEMRIRITADEAWDKMQCDDIEAVFYTQETLQDMGMPLECFESKLKFVEFRFYPYEFKG